MVQHTEGLLVITGRRRRLAAALLSLEADPVPKTCTTGANRSDRSQRRLRRYDAATTSPLVSILLRPQFFPPRHRGFDHQRRIGLRMISPSNITAVESVRSLSPGPTVGLWNSADWIPLSYSVPAPDAWALLLHSPMRLEQRRWNSARPGCKKYRTSCVSIVS